MLRRSVAACAGLLAVLALVVGCSGTTIISEGTLGSGPAATPADAPSASGEQSASSDPDEASGDTAADDAEDAASADDDIDGNAGDLSALGLVGEEQIASLARDCEAGSDPACDILYQASTLASPEEDLARSCGGREPANAAFCTEGIEPAAEGLWFDEASPGLTAVEQACIDGDLTACDFLYFRSEVGSAYEEIGTTCGGRVDVAIPDCRTVLGE